jgi:hypothetical protein
MRVFSAFVTAAILAIAAPAAAQSPPAYPSVLTPPPLPATPAAHPHTSPRPTAVMTFRNPAAKGGSTPMSAAACNRSPVYAQQRLNPITGQPQTATLVSIPVTKGGGSIASATTRKGQQEACAHH